MNVDETFPLGLAIGPAFCDRIEERRRLAEAVFGPHHVWLSAPRRYGKSSLVAQALVDLERRRARLVQATVDLLPAYDAASAAGAILAAVGRASGQLLPGPARVAHWLRQTFGRLRAEAVVDAEGPRVRFAIGAAGPEAVEAGLRGLDAAAARAKRRVVLVFDEFQQLAALGKEGHAIEAAVRSIAQGTRASAYVFSGSRRSLLAQMFESPRRPLYRLCEGIPLARIPAEDYRAHLDRAARRRWHRGLSDAALEVIVGLTERHPHYVNRLCNRLWRRERMPGPAAVEEAWHAIVAAERDGFVSELARLTPPRRAVLVALARRPTAQPTARAFLDLAGLAASTVRASLRWLLDEDLVELDPTTGEHRVLDPALRTYLAQIAEGA
ncbi:MAG TPA: hypothetical protein ENJ83_04790 [Rhodospirillales bacterium]|nr:hypothetical protein [Rhodospirillales bacterium]